MSVSGKKAVYSVVDLSKKKKDRELAEKGVKAEESSELKEITSKIDATDGAKEPAADSADVVPSAAAAPAVENGLKKPRHKYEEIDGIESQPVLHHNYEDVDDPVDQDHQSLHDASPPEQQVAKPASGAPKSSYMMISTETLESNVNPSSTRYEDTNITNTSKELTPVTQTERKCVCHNKFMCIVCSAIVFIFIFVGMCVCLAFIYIEVRNLRSELVLLNNMPADGSAETDLLMSSDEQCCSMETCEAIREALDATVTLEKFEELEELTYHVLETIDSLGQPSTPAASCAALFDFLPSSPSGYYWVRTSNGSAVHMYCDMNLSCGGITGGWTRVAYLNITDNSSTQCPHSLPFRDDLMLCAIESSSVIHCSSTLFNSSDVLYSSVCGRVTAYQGGSPEAFHPENGVDQSYVSGVSLTHGSPRQHIWTFAAASSETHNCPCSNSSGLAGMLSFVRNDYFCNMRDPTTGSFELDDALWNGADCSSPNKCCTFNNPPWFYRQLPQPTTDNIEMRVCRNEPRTNIGIEALELYVQ